MRPFSAQSMITHQVDPHEQGRLQGALTSLQSFAGIFGPALFANLFALFISNHAPVKHLPGAAFLLAAILIATALLLTARITRGMPRHLHAAPTAPETLVVE